jgi:glycosyltransferase involved in cell wall biosynthesis
MVTPYPPYRDGIGTYAVQEVRRMRAAGRRVEVLSPLPSAAHHHLALGGLRGILALVKRARGYGSVIVQFSPEMFFGACHGPPERIAVWACIEALARTTRLEIRLHEIEFGPLEQHSMERAAAARALGRATVTVHTKAEIANLERVLGLDPAGIDVVEHGQNFVMATSATQAEARHELGLDPVEHVFLAIGFLQEHKGFDRAVQAFARAGLADRASLHVVGSVRVDHPELLAYADRLARLCRATPSVTLHQKYVSDEEFDRWIVAADTVVLPYREIWSSSVLERAKLCERVVIAADVGGMSDQAPAGTLFFDDEEGLLQAMGERVGVTAHRQVEHDGAAEVGPPEERAAAVAGSGWEVDRGHPDRGAIEAQIRARVRHRSLTGDREPVRPRSDRETGHGVVSTATGGTDGGSAIDPLIAIGKLQRPHPVSARRGVSQAKRLLRRAVNWEVEPLAAQLVALQRATIESIAELEARLAAERDGAARGDVDDESPGRTNV